MRNSSTPQPRTFSARQVSRRRRLASLVSAVLVVGLAPAFIGTGSAAADEPAAKPAATSHWKKVEGKPAKAKNGHKPDIVAAAAETFTLDRSGLENDLADAPRERTKSARTDPLVVSLPAPDGALQRFALQEAPIMEPELAAQHPEIATYSGVGVDDPTATLRADLTSLGFHASVRSPRGNWYVDPYYNQDQSLYASYYARDLEDRHGDFVERDDLETAANLKSEVTAAVGDVPVGPAVQLRTYRLAMITDPSYATYFGAANVTAAKVTLINRVTQIYEDEMAVRLVLIADSDKTNLNTAAQATEPNGPCGTSPCFTTAHLSSCTGAALNRNRIVLGQIIGASNYDIGHLALGNPGGGVASLNAVGGNAKAQGCTGLPTPVGDFFAVDYVAHEMGHQFGGNHTFNGTQHNCGGNKAAPSVEPGSGSSIMAYAGICRHDNLQPHSDPYWSQWSYQEIMAYITSSRPAINEVQNASLRQYDTNGDAFAIAYGANKTAPFVRGTNYSQAALQLALQGVPEVQRVTLTDYDATDSYRLAYGGNQSVPITRGQNNTTAGIAAALQGGNEQQQVTLTGFNPATTAYRVKIGDATSGLIGLGGVAVSNNNVAAAVNAISGFAGTVSSTGAGNGGFTLTFGGASAGTDVPSVEIVECACTSVVRENVKGSAALASWPAGGTVTVGSLADTGYTLTFGGTHQGTDVADVTVVDAVGTTGSVAEVTKGSAGLLPPGATATVAGWGGTGTADDLGFQVSFGGTFAGQNLESLQLVDFVGADGFVGETAKGGAIDNAGHTVAATSNNAPVVTSAGDYTIPLRTPFALTGSATDSNGDPLTYMWEQKDRGGGAGTALTDNNKVNGPLFRQFGTAARVSATDTLLTPSPGLNAVGTDPTRVFPDLAQILANNTNAVSGTCNPFTGVWPVEVPLADVDCYSEFLPTAAYVGVPGVNAAPASLNFRLTVRDSRPGGGGIGSADTSLTLAPTAGPFLVTSQSTAAEVPAGSAQAVTWDVAGTNLAPVSTENVKISLSLDGGYTYPNVLAASTANDGSQTVTVPDVSTSKARIKVEALGNVYFDISATDFTIRGAGAQLGDLVAASTGVGPGKALENKAREASANYAAGNMAATCASLASYVDLVNAQIGKKLTAAQAAQLSLVANRIRTAILC